MRIIGLTGGIACGKSTISLTLKSLGATIIDGDQLSRALTQPGGLALPAIRAEFGSEVFHADSTLDRRALGSLIFASDERRHALDDLMQPLLREMIEREILRAKEGGAKICVLDMPLLGDAWEMDIDSYTGRIEFIGQVEGNIDMLVKSAGMNLTECAVTDGGIDFAGEDAGSGGVFRVRLAETGSQ